MYKTCTHLHKNNYSCMTIYCIILRLVERRSFENFTIPLLTHSVSITVTRRNREHPT